MDGLHLFNHPVVAALLLTLGFLGLAVEIRSEGFQRAGWAGLLALGLFVASHLAEGTPPWTALPMVVGVAVLWPALHDPRRRWAAGLGTLLLATGAYVVLVGPGPAHLDHALAGAVLAASTLLVLLAGLLVWTRLPATLRPARRTGVFFFVPDGEEVGDPASDDLVGERGTALSPLRPGGWALVGGRRIEVVAEGEWIAEGDPVEVVDGEGIRPVVRGAAAREPDPAAS